MTWHVGLDYFRGKTHKKLNLPCQDYGAVQYLSNTHLVGAIADGAGSASLSAIGAKLVVKSCLLEMARLQGDMKDFHKQQENFLTLLIKIKESLLREAERRKVEVQELASTLTAFVLTPEGLAAFQIGDGFLVYQTEGVYYSAFMRDTGYINETTFLTSKDAFEKVKFCFIRKPVTFLAAGTDGVQSVAMHLKDHAPHPGFFKAFEESLKVKKSKSKRQKELRMFLNSKRLDAYTGDDKTLLICRWHEEEF